MSQTELLNLIRQLNNDVKVDSERNRYLKRMLAQQPNIMGIIISKPTGKCIGTIENTGKINHVSRKEAKSPYNIVVKNNNEIDIHDMLIKNDLHGLPAHKIVVKVLSNSSMKILGQTVDIKGKIVGLIIRTGRTNNYIQTKPGEPLSDIPILAILHKSSTPEPKPIASPAQPAKPVVPVAPIKPAAPAVPVAPIKPAAPVAPKLAPAADKPQGDCVKPTACTAEPVIASSGVKASPVSTAVTGIKTQMSNLWKRI